MTNHTARMAALLGELRREMNGAVAESMQRGEGGYGLNYGVSIPAIRAIAGRVGTDQPVLVRKTDGSLLRVCST